MKHLKKALLIMLSMLLIASLSGCSLGLSEQMTSEELLDAVFDNEEDVDSLRVDLNLECDIEVDLKDIILSQGLTEKEIEDAIESGEIKKEDLNQKIYMAYGLEVLTDENKSHMTGTMRSELGEEKEKQKIDRYTSIEDEEIITYDYSDEEWYKSTSYYDEEEYEEYLSDFIKSFKDSISKSEIVDREGSVYELEIEVDLDDFDLEEMEDILYEMDLDDVLTEEVISDIDNIEMLMKIDSKEDRIVGLYIDLEEIIKEALEGYEDTDYSKCVKINKAYIELEISDYGEVKVKIPKEVLEAEEEDLDFSVDLDDLF